MRFVDGSSSGINSSAIGTALAAEERSGRRLKVGAGRHADTEARKVNVDVGIPPVTTGAPAVAASAVPSKVHVVTTFKLAPSGLELVHSPAGISNLRSVPA